jgi:hypothetical protein
MVTTIQVSDKLMKELKRRKMHDNESYESVIWDLIEDTLELSEQTKKNIALSEKQIASGKTIPLSQIKKELGFKNV